MSSFHSSTASGAAKAAFREQMKDVFTCVPGHVLSLEDDGANQRAQIQVGIERVDINGASFDLPPIINVPIQFIGDDYVLEHEIQPGCEGMIYFSQRCVDGWKNTGGIAQNPLGRFHDVQDAFFAPGFRSLPNVFPEFQNNGMRMRNRAGTQFAWLKNDGSIAIENGFGHIRMAADGVVTINGVIIDLASLVTTPNDIKAGAISLKLHRHGGVEVGGGTTGGSVA